MKSSILKRIFGKDNSVNVGKSFNSFSIVPNFYENDLDKKYGIRLGGLRNGGRSGFCGDLENNVSFRGGNNCSASEIEERILNKYDSVSDFCCMRIGDIESLMEHMRFVHEVSYNHYVFGKEENLKWDFPNRCCDVSARNLLLTLMEKGYPNATFFYNDRYTHAYNGLPFVFGEEAERGFIIVDPTSDQLFDDKKHAPRNNVFVVPGAKWKYETDWGIGSDLFPCKKDNSTFSNLHTLRKYPRSYVYMESGIRKYFSNVFDNVVDVKLGNLN